MIGGKELAGLVVALLNEALELDPVAISALCVHRVPCQIGLAMHPKIQVKQIGAQSLVQYEVGMIGILNGLCGVDSEGRGAIAAEFDDKEAFGDPDNPPRVLRFVVLDREVS